MLITLDSKEILIQNEYDCLKEYIKTIKTEYEVEGIAKFDGFSLSINQCLPFYYDNDYVTFDMEVINLPFSEYEDYHINEILLYTEYGFGGVEPNYAILLYRAIDDFFRNYPFLSNVSFLVVTNLVSYFAKHNLIPYLKEFIKSLKDRNKNLNTNLFKDTIDLADDEKDKLNKGFEIITDMYNKGYLDDLYKYDEQDEEVKG